MTEGGSGTGLEPIKTVIEDKEKGESTEEDPGAKQDKDREEPCNIVEHQYCQTVT